MEHDIRSNFGIQVRIYVCIDIYYLYIVCDGKTLKKNYSTYFYVGKKKEKENGIMIG